MVVICKVKIKKMIVIVFISSQCINNFARKMGINCSLDLPDKTLQFIRDRPLMDEAVRPLTGGPLLVKKGALLTRIVVDSVLALDGQRYAVMFVGTGKIKTAYCICSTQGTVFARLKQRMCLN